MAKAFKIVYIIVSVLFLVYLILPAPSFPYPPSNSSQSDEPADTESSLRRAYFTDSTREEVIQNYMTQFRSGVLPTLRLNLPPEDAQTVIRDQTRSTFLEELVHPFRESFYINGFEPKDEKDIIQIKGVNWRQKITVKYVESSLWVRLGIAVPTLVLGYLIIRQWAKEV
ncbi:MAG TPA: hypothetical protein VF185_02905 [Patescibacteria group bacterium]